MRFKVGTNTDAMKLASAITQNISENDIELSSLGAGAVNQAVKAVIIARSLCINRGIEFTSVPCFEEAELNGETKTFIVHSLQLVK